MNIILTISYDAKTCFAIAFFGIIAVVCFFSSRRMSKKQKTIQEKLFLYLGPLSISSVNYDTKKLRIRNWNELLEIAKQIPAYGRGVKTSQQFHIYSLERALVKNETLTEVAENQRIFTEYGIDDALQILQQLDYSQIMENIDRGLGITFYLKEKVILVKDEEPQKVTVTLIRPHHGMNESYVHLAPVANDTSYTLETKFIFKPEKKTA